MARQLKVVSGHAAGCQETKTGQGSREGSGSGQADPGHQKVQAGRLHHYWAKGSGSDLSYAVYRPNSVFSKADKLDRRLGISSKLAGGLRQKNNTEDAGRAGQNTVKAEEYAQLPLI